MRASEWIGALMIGAFPMVLAAQQPKPPSLNDAELRPLYSLIQTVRVMADVCSEQFPQHAASVATAVAAWGDKHGRAPLDSLIERTARRRAAIGRAFIRGTSTSLFNGDPAAACGNFGAFIATATYDLGVQDLPALQAARLRLGLPAWTPPATSPTVAAVPLEPSPSATPPEPSATATADTMAAPRPRAPARSPAEIMRERVAATRGTGADTPGAGQAGRSPSGGTRPFVPTAVSLQPPPGWIVTPARNTVAEFATAPTDSGAAVIVVDRPQPLAGRPIDVALRAWLRARVGSQIDVSLVNTVQRARTIRGQPVAYADETPDIIGRERSAEMRVIGVAIAHVDGTFTGVLFLARSDEHRYTMRQYDLARQFEVWLRSAPLPGETGPANWSPAAPVVTRPLQGLWLGTTLRNQLNIYGGMDLIADRRYAVLYPTGMAYHAMPTGGQIDVASPQQLCTGDDFDACGTYRVTGRSIIFDTFTDHGFVRSDTTELAASGSPDPSFFRDGANMGRFKPASPGRRLQGSYTTLEGSSSGPNGSLNLARTIVFHRDGRYETDRFVGVTSTPGASGGADNGTVVVTNQSATRTGTYEIRGFTLILRPDAGAPRYATIVFFEDDPDASSVLIDDEYYRR